MILTEKALAKINTGPIRLRLALKLGFTEGWIQQLINKNKPNSPLTTIAALQVIREETGLGDQEILEEEHERAVA